MCNYIAASRYAPKTENTKKIAMEWHDNINNDPYEEYREPPHGCRDTIIACMLGIALVAFLLMAGGCRTQQPLVQTRDSVRVELRHDSVYVYSHDSIFRDRWRTGDTVYITVERWATRYKDKLIEVHDTLTNTQTEQVAVKYVPAYYRNTSNGFWVLLAVLLLLISWKIAKRYIKAKTGGLI